MDKKEKKLRGFSLMELVFGMVILGILMSLAIMSYSAGKDKANDLVIDEAFDAYSSAIIDSFAGDPSIQLSSADAVESIKTGKESNYSPEIVHRKIVNSINRIVEDKLKLSWNLDTRRYESSSEDPYGGKYILVDAPVDLTGHTDSDEFSTKDYTWTVDNISAEDSGKPAYKLLIASTGKSDSIDDYGRISDKDKAITVCISGGLVDVKSHGEDAQLFTENYYIPWFN